MTNAFLPTDAVAVFPISFVDQIGRPVAAPAGVSFVSAVPGVDTLSFDGSNLTVTPAADGTDTITVAGLTGSQEITVGAPVATAVVFGEPTYQPKL